jgi:hypothetical protein
MQSMMTRMINILISICFFSVAFLGTTTTTALSQTLVSLEAGAVLSASFYFYLFSLLLDSVSRSLFNGDTKQVNRTNRLVFKSYLNIIKFI